MAFYTCTICNKIFNQKCNYTYHLNRKFKCVNNNVTNNEYTCKTCGKNFTTNSNMNRHKKNIVIKLRKKI